MHMYVVVLAEAGTVELSLTVCISLYFSLSLTCSAHILALQQETLIKLQHASHRSPQIQQQL